MPIPARQRQEMSIMTRAADEFSERLGRDPSDEELATVLGMPHKKVIKLRNSIRSRIPLSVHEEQDDEEGGSPDIAAHTHQPFEDWQDAIYHGLGDIDKVIFMHRTGYRSADKLSNKDIAAKVGLTPGAVSQRAARMQARLDEFNG
jgi:DNA-directed RNA polymerase specialized sigma subunit